jgi:virulence-associated protein VagC
VAALGGGNSDQASPPLGAATQGRPYGIPCDFEGTKVEIKKRGDEVVLRPRPKPRLKTLADVARFMHESFPEGRDFPDREQPLSPQGRDLDLDQD